ncbi:YybH family protein [Streptomyces sp. NPDC091217]|uniref:YybH family protein n=1 Tax=Streptomyces sp. NPDC091217 TaxID=3365975 RepID=UPI0037F98C07
MTTGIDAALPLSDVPGVERLPSHFVTAVRSVERAGKVMRGGDPSDYIACWAPRDDVSLFGAWGPIERGADSLARTFRWVGTRFTGGDVEFVYSTVHCSGDLGITVGFERGLTSIDGASEQRMVIRVTHVYRRSEDGWFLIHRHADFPPRDERVSAR